MKLFKYVLAFLLISTNLAMASEADLSLDEDEVKEDIARTLGLDSQEFTVSPIAAEYVNSGVGLKGRLYITWSVKSITASEESMTITSNDVEMTNSSDLDKSEEGEQVQSIKIGYQVFEHVGLETSYERSSSTMGIKTLSGISLGSMSAPVSSTAKNDFHSFKIGLSTNANLIDARSFRLDLAASVNAGVITLNSTYKTKGDIYKDAFGYSTGAEASVRAIHKSGVYLSTGVGMNNKTLAPKKYIGGTESKFSGSEKYIFVNVGYSFGGKRKR